MQFDFLSRSTVDFNSNSTMLRIVYWFAPSTEDTAILDHEKGRKLCAIQVANHSLKEQFFPDKEEHIKSRPLPRSVTTN